MKAETRLFEWTGYFFALSALAYGFSTWKWGHGGLEPVGTAALVLVAGLSLMIGVYLRLTARRIDPRPEDDPAGQISDLPGDQGAFAPWSWWPLALAGSAALCFLGLAVGWWVFIIGALIGVVALVGWVFEFSRGQHSH
ncbi:cytochrome c oxidase subunit 4 [Rarobacter faecitabidus]|uniref:Cytochrome c oxidase polypeptide 4 n=1 Tax=Rarobacter faecitabidus TaxID=13243 RepID=A0A542ZVD7_RARFA|nr:cytochrome c oxidase subunit 4 [Rarobacter faecitabidus]TQL64328.1 cytochrome c oxidase subunit IV [Rarobacter faecitabidus]